MRVAALRLWASRHSFYDGGVQAREPEVDETPLAVLAAHDVVTLEVPVHEAVRGVEGCERSRDLQERLAQVGPHILYVRRQMRHQVGQRRLQGLHKQVQVDL